MINRNLISILLELLLLLSLISCFDTRDQRVKIRPVDPSLYKSDAPYRPNVLPGDTSSSTTTTTTSTTTQTTTPPSHIAHCKWSQDGVSGHEFNSNHIGNYTLCKSSSSETDLYFQLKNNPGYTICFIPVNESNSNVVYIGEPRCLLASDPMTVYKIVMLKNRPSTGYNSYSNLAMTGVMIMQDRAYEFPAPYYPSYSLSYNPLRAPDAYLLCANWYQAGYPQYCQAFNSAGHYVYHKF